MQRLIIITMLGTIGYSTLVSFILPSIPKQNKYMLLDTVFGSVLAGNFSYWSFDMVGPLFIELTTVKGDADIFVAANIRPSFEADKNNFSSETCGVDTVYIPDEFPRPIGIGIFGYWAHQRSDFMMKVYLDYEIMKTIYKHRPEIQPTTNKRVLDADLKRSEMAAKKDEISRLSETESKRREVARKEEEKPKFLKLFRVLDTVFDLFIL